MEVIRKTIENKGIFYCLYVDKASCFKTTRYGGLHVKINQEQDDTQIERALKELNINLIPANSP
jgi:starvation-inducible outer membrane lipoprotein